MRLYFFPAFLPLAEALPWLLTAFGALAGFLLRASRSRPRAARIAAVLFALTVLAAAGRYAAPRLWWWWHKEESRLAAPTELPPRDELGLLPGEEPVETNAVFAAGRWRADWSVRPGRRALSNPLRAGSLYLLGTWEGTVDAYSLENGAPVWKLRKREPVYAMTVASPGLLLAGEGLHDSATSSLTAVLLPRGEPLWQREFRGHIESAPAYSHALGLVWVGTGPAGLWSLRASDGAIAWHAAVGHVDSTPLLAGKLLLFSSQPDEGRKESTFWAVRAVDGTPAWNLPLPGQPWGSPQLDAASGLVLVTTGVGQVGVKRTDDRGWAHGISLEGHKTVWTSELGGNPIEKSLLADGLAIYVLTKGEVVAVHARDGKPAWRLPLPGEVQADPALSPDSGLLAVVGTDGLLSLIDARTGRLLETRQFDKGTGSAPLFLRDGMLVTTPYVHTRFHW